METRYYLGYRYPRTRRGRVCALPVGLGRPDPPPYQFARPDARPEPWRIVRARRSCRMCDLCRACLLPLLRSLGHGLCTRPLRRTARHPIGDRAGTSGRDLAEPFSSIALRGRSYNVSLPTATQVSRPETRCYLGYRYSCTRRGRQGASCAFLLLALDDQARRHTNSHGQTHGRGRGGSCALVEAAGCTCAARTCSRCSGVFDTVCEPVRSEELHAIP